MQSEDVVLVLPHMCKNGTTVSRAVTEMCIMFSDDKNVRILTSQWLLGMISTIDPDKMDVLCRRMLKNTIRKRSGLEKKTGHMLVTDKHLIPLTGADGHNDSFVISGRPKGGTYQFQPDCVAFSGSTRSIMVTIRKYGIDFQVLDLTHFWVNWLRW